MTTLPTADLLVESRRLLALAALRVEGEDITAADGRAVTALLAINRELDARGVYGDDGSPR